MSFWRKTLLLVEKDLRTEARTKEMTSSMLFFALIVVVVFSFAFDPTKAQVRATFPGIIWVAFFFAGVLGFGRSFAAEKLNDSLLGLILCPADRSIIFFGKMIGNLIFMLAMEAVTLPVFLVFFDYSIGGSLLQLTAVLFLGTLGFCSVGTFLAALASNTRNSEILLPLILFPLEIPVVLAVVNATGMIFSGSPPGDYLSWMKLLIGFDIIFIVIPYLLFDYLLEG